MSPRWLIAFDDRAAAPQYLVGERWTLLIVRELLMGPKRYTDLRAGLPGIASNLLGERLGQLGETGLVRRERPAASGAGDRLPADRARARARDGDHRAGSVGRPGARRARAGSGLPRELVRARHARHHSGPGMACALDAGYEFHISRRTFSLPRRWRRRPGRGRDPPPHRGSSSKRTPRRSPRSPQPVSSLSTKRSPSGAREAQTAAARASTRVLRIFRFPADQTPGAPTTDDPPARGPTGSALTPGGRGRHLVAATDPDLGHTAAGTPPPRP